MITHERWQRIKEIFNSAQDCKPAERSEFLNEVCGDDAVLREEVEALLTADADNENFLTSPAYEFAAGVLASETTEFLAGQTVGRFEILCPLGAGGMGQIYLARDAQLGRNIALKLISQEFASDPRRVVRFEQEARAASALNHPNVCVIHEIGMTENGRHFIAMEYIQGVTLRDQLARGPLNLHEALQTAIQVGTALASAHAVGIVHRDIKPENIMLRPDGYVKVVDFGLAKLTEALPEQQRLGQSQTMVRTEPRTVMGTVKYMSPEQLREAPVDERTDIWSLGIVLYEMLTGSTPFDAQSPNESIALILSAEPAQLSFPEAVPIQYREIVKKTLERNCNGRYQTISKVIADLSRLQRALEQNADYLIQVPENESSSIPYTPALHEQPTRGSAIFTLLKSQAILTADTLITEIRTHRAAALFAGATSVLGLLLLIPTVSRWVKGIGNPAGEVQQPTGTVHARPIKALTNSGTAVCSAISFDGKWMAHAEKLKGKQQLVVTNIAASGSFSVAVPPEDVEYVGITFSRDNQLYFTRKENHGPGILYRLAWPDTNPVKIKTNVDSPISFSPPGDRFTFVRHDEATSEYWLMLSNIDGSNEQVVAVRKDGHRFSVYGPAWSPDGSRIVCAESFWDKGKSFQTNLVSFDLTNGSEQLIGGPWFSVSQVAWQQDMNSLVINGRDSITSPHHLWRIGFPAGDRERITSDLNDYAGVSLSGENIVTVSTNLSWGLWVASLDESEKPTQIATGVGLNYGLSWTSQGKIVYSSMVQDRLNISRIDPNGSNKVPLTTVGDNFSPASSADGRFIVFSSNRDGYFNIWRVNADDGSEPIQLTFSDGNFYPSVSPDNQWVAYDNLIDSGISIWKVPMNGGDPIKVTEKCRMAVFSLNSQLIACRYDLDSGTRDVAIFSAHGGGPLRQFAVPIQEWQRIQWLPNERELSYVKNDDGYSNIWSYDLERKTSKQLTNFNSDQIYAYAWSPDYKQVACQRGTKLSDVTMISER
jgi:serine/threonine protein kinase/Tol biopolymer transport system component